MPKIHRDRPPTYSYPIGVLPVPVEPAAEQGPEEDAPSPPAASATRTKWAAYAAEFGVATVGLTKAQIRKKVS